MTDRPATRIKWKVGYTRQRHIGGEFTIHACIDNRYYMKVEIPAAYIVSPFHSTYCFKRALEMQGRLLNQYLWDNF